MAKQTKKTKSTDFSVIEPIASQAAPETEVKEKKVKKLKASKKKTVTKKTKTSKALKAKKTGLFANDYVVIDYPINNEVINQDHYSIRIGASEGTVELSFNKKDWSKCRHAGGYWWFDFSKKETGKKSITARLIESASGTVKKTSKSRRIQIT